MPPGIPPAPPLFLFECVVWVVGRGLVRALEGFYCEEVPDGFVGNLGFLRSLDFGDYKVVIRESVLEVICRSGELVAAYPIDKVIKVSDEEVVIDCSVSPGVYCVINSKGFNYRFNGE